MATNLQKNRFFVNKDLVSYLIYLYMTYVFNFLLFGVWYYFHNASSLIICRLNIKIDYLEKRIEELETENKKKNIEIETGKMIIEQRLMKCEDVQPIQNTIVDEIVILTEDDIERPQPKKHWLW